MSPEFYDAYRDLADLYRMSDRYRSFFPPFRRRRDIHIIDEVITQVVNELNLQERIRPDARFFLLVNVDQMIVMPLSYSGNLRVDRQPLNEMIRTDVRTILRTASERVDQQEISGHRVVNVLSEIWGRLDISKLDVWG
jgi:hypothetical protein